MVCLAVGVGAAAECAARRHAGPRMTSLMSAVHAFHFLRTWWLLALIPAWALFVWLGWRRRNTGRWAGIIDAELLVRLWLETGIDVRRSATLACLGMAWSRSEAGCVGEG